MIDLSILQAKVNALKAQIFQNSITPVYLGTILDEFIARMHDLDMTDRADDIQQAVNDAADAVANALTALAAAGTASANSAQAVEKASEALVKANAAIDAAQAAQAAAEAAANSADIAQSFAGTIPDVRNGSTARFSAFVTGPVTTETQEDGSGSTLQPGGDLSGGLQTQPQGAVTAGQQDGDSGSTLQPGGGVSGGLAAGQPGDSSIDGASFCSVVYLKAQKAFALKLGTHYFLPWTNPLFPVSMYNDSSNKPLKNKIFLCGDKAYVWSSDDDDLVELGADKAPLSMFVFLSESEYEALEVKDENKLYFLFEDPS